MKKSLLLIIGLLLLPVCVQAATDYWFEGFDGLAGAQPAGWRDETNDNTFNAEIACSYTSSWAAITRTAESTYGKVLSAIQNPDVALYPSVEVVVTSVSASATWRLGIQEEEGSFQHRDLSGPQTGPGTFSYNYAAAFGWTSGTHALSVELILEGNTTTAIEVDSVRISTAPTPTPTPTVGPVFWTENFTGTANNPVPGWRVLDPAPEPVDFNARIYYTGAGGAYVEVTPAASVSFGKVLSPVQTVNTANYPLLELKVLALDADAYWKVRIQEEEGPGPRGSWDLRAYTQRAGVFVFDYASITGWTSGIHLFSIEIDVEGGFRKKIELDSIRILNASALPTPVVTPTPYAAEFDLDASPPDGWRYSSVNSPSPIAAPEGVRMYSLGGYAYLTFTAAFGADLIGKALSTTITVDTDSYPELWFWVTDAYPFNCTYTVSLWTENVGVFPVFASGRNTTGLKKIEYRDLIRQDAPGWGGPQALNLELKMEGEIGGFIKMDFIRFEPPAPTPTITPTPVSNTLRPAANLFRPDQGPLTIDYRVQSTDTIRITVFNTAGRKVRTLLEQHASGQVSSAVEWDGKNEAGDWVGSGVYVIRIESKDLVHNTRFFKNVRVAVVR